MTKDLPFLPQDIIAAKRDDREIPPEDIQAFVAGITDQTVTDPQIAAFAMAVFLRGMTAAEGATLTLAMRDSGTVIDWTQYGFDQGAPIVDKHSTGGVGDKVSLMLAPIVAAAGGFVPMISGRGLGHTGGTLDKLESIPGYDAYPDVDRFAEITKTIGCSIIGQTSALAPADKRFYAVRDVTATVESIPLITASILSKKLAAGLGALVMDVKFGTGAFMADYGQAEALAKNIVRVGEAAGTPISALLTDMNEVLGRTAGNAVELYETCSFLTDPAGADPRLKEITLALASEMLTASGAVSDRETADRSAAQVLTSGAAAEVFARMVVAQGGPSDILTAAPDHAPLAPLVREVPSADSGTVVEVDTRAVGQAIVALGGGRTDPAQTIDHGVGLDHIAGIGTEVSAGDPLARVYARSEGAAEAAARVIQGAFAVGEGRAGPSRSAVARRLTVNDI